VNEIPLSWRKYNFQGQVTRKWVTGNP